MADLAAIADIRRAAAREAGMDERTDEILIQALAGWEPAEMIALAEHMLRKGLPGFERHHPSADWPRRALDGEVTGLSPEYPGPGGNSLASGVEDLLEARERTGDPAACRRLVASAIGEAVMGEMCAVWGDLYPEGWRRSFEAAERDILLPYAEDPMIGWGEHPAVSRVQHEWWNEVADRIAAHG